MDPKVFFFLTEKRQRVVLNEEISSWRRSPADYRKQDSVLGMFVFFINDLPECLRNEGEIFLHADDTKIITICDSDDYKKMIWMALGH